MNNQHNLYAHLDSATFTQRFIAIIIDTILLSFVSVLLISMKMGGVYVFVFLGYMIFMQYQFGYTFGKKAVGIRVIYEGSASNSLFTFVFRETLGRIISYLFFGIGYLMAIFTDERKALHDIMFKTRVVSLNPVDTSPIGQILKSFGAIIAVTVLSFIGYFYVILYTSYPLKMAMNQLNIAGFETRGISGSYQTGYKIKSVIFNNEDLTMELNDLEMKLSNIYAIFTQEKIGIDKIKVSSGSFELLKFDWKKLKKDKKQEDKNIEKKKDKQTKTAKKEIPFYIKDFDVRNLTFKGQGQSFFLKQFKIQNWNITKKMIDIEKMVVATDAYEGMLKGSYFDLENETASIYFVGKINKKNDIIPNLKKSLNFTLIAKGDENNANFDFYGFDNRIHAKIDYKKGKMPGTELTFTNLTLAHFFDQKIPIYNVSLKTNKDSISGSYRIRNRKMTIPKQPLVMGLLAGLKATSQQGDKVVFLPTAVMMNKPIFLIETAMGSKGAPNANILSELYLRKSFTELSPKSRKKVLADAEILRKNPMQSLDFLNGLLKKPRALPTQQVRSFNRFSKSKRGKTNNYPLRKIQEKKGTRFPASKFQKAEQEYERKRRRQ